MIILMKSLWSWPAISRLFLCVSHCHLRGPSIPSCICWFHARHKQNRCPSATRTIFPVTDYRTAFSLHPISHPVPCWCCNHLYWQPTLWLLCRSSPVRTFSIVITAELEAIWTQPQIAFCQCNFTVMLTKQPNAKIKGSYERIADIKDSWAIMLTKSG